MENFTLQELISAVSGHFVGGTALAEDTPVPDVCIDSRVLTPGAVFVPIIGENFDGHDFIDAAFARGAVAALTQRDISMAPSSLPLIRVTSTGEAFLAIAAAYRAKFPIPLIGVTGSVGKTTTKEMIASVLSTAFRTLKTEGNLNNQTGVPLTLLRLAKAYQAAVVEMGANHFGEIAALARCARPDICVITNIGESHLEFFGSKEGILRAKSEMLPYRAANGRIVVNGDDPYLLSLRESYPILTYGEGETNDVYATDIVQLGLEGVRFNAHIAGECLPVTLPVPGSHMVHNALCAMTCGHLLGIPLAQLAAGASAYQAASGRLNIVKTRTLTLINDAYNASPTAMRSSIGAATHATGRSVLILGDMFELGEDAPRYHAEMGAAAAKAGAGLLLCVGALSAHMYHAARAAGLDARHYANKEALMEALPALLCPGDTVLVKASHGMQLETVAAFIRERF